MSLYDKLDDKIMKVVNIGVKAYNWTIGGTKGDLASILEISGTALWAVSLPCRFGYDKVLITVPLTLGGSFLSWYSNSEEDKMEERALKRGCLDPVLEDRKNIAYKFGSPMTAIMGTSLIASSCYKNIEEFGIPFGTGFFMWGAGFYARRADYLPPRKNCFSRGLDKVKEWIKNREQHTAGVPAPVYVQTKLEEQIVL